MKTEQLLSSLGWPTSELDNKGIVNWQKSPHPDNENSLPITASIVVTPKRITARVLNVLPSDNMDQHMLLEWNIEGDDVVLQKYLYAGEDLSHKFVGKPESFEALADGFRGLVLSFQALGKKDILGKRRKDQSISSSNPTQAPSQTV